ncbi:MAG: DEAD/DEAH box helicase [Betaproteobacteria bacterium]
MGFPGPIHRYQENHITTSFQNLGLSAELLRAVAEQGYTVPTPIQAQAIPVVLAGRDLLGAAQTGTGKTAGFTLPILQLLSTRLGEAHTANHGKPVKQPVRVLILTPTRELCAQVNESVKTYGKFLKLKSTMIFGGVGFNPQVSELRRGVDIIVATPGRLLDHVQQRTVDLRSVEILVLDEADRMLDMGFLPDIRRIMSLLPMKRQNLLFSATFSDEIRKLSNTFMKDPASIEVARRNSPIELVTQVVHPVDKDRKRELLAHLVKTHNWFQVLVFTKTKHGANRLAEQLNKDGIESDAIHGNKSQPQRTRALKRFKDNEVQVLVATDIAARGLDIDALPHVVNYDLPNVPEDYVHRIGRTGRAGSTGDAVSLVCREDRSLLTAIERMMKKQVPVKIVPGFEAGSPSLRPAEPRDPNERQERPEQQRRGQPDGRRGGQRDGQRPAPRDGQRPRPASSGQGQARDGQRDGQRRDSGAPRRPGGQPGQGQRPQYNRGPAANSERGYNSNGPARSSNARQNDDNIGNRAPAAPANDPSKIYDERQPDSFESRLAERATAPAQNRPRQHHNGNGGNGGNGQRRDNKQSPALFGPRKVA